MINYRNLPEGIHTGDVRDGETLAMNTAILTAKLAEAAVVAIGTIPKEEFLEHASRLFDSMVKNIEDIANKYISDLSKERSKKPDGPI